MKAKQYVYWVAYSHTRGFGASEITSPTPITTSDHVAGCAKAIAAGEPARSAGTRQDEIVVLTFTLLRSEAVPS